MKNPIRCRCPGFALVITLSLMVLLTILAVGIMSLASVSLRHASIGNHEQIAHANARIAMIIALGELQKHLGPDARATARAETLARDTRMGTSVSPNTPQSWWVGVSHSDGKTKLQPSDKDVVWLLSGLNGGLIDGTLADPVTLIGAGSLDLPAFTGGLEIKAGRVSVRNGAGKTTGAYAWFVDDNGMRAQLRASHPNITNNHPTHPSGGVLAASYNPAILREMETFSATPQQIQRIGSLGDLCFLGLTKATTERKFFSYTTRSLGVLSDTRNGGLKKDLTIAFENPAVFASVFPTGNTPEYLLISREKLDASAELKSNGYIHWAILRDYYNLKKHIKTIGSSPTLQIQTFSKNPYLFDTSRVNKAPHQLFDGSARPYGQPHVFAGGAYINNPISPVLAHLQQNCWLEYIPSSGTVKPKLITNAQLWSSHYNPYNIALNVFNDPGTGARLMNFPMIAVTVDGYLKRVNTIHAKLEVHAPGQAVIPPGKSQLLGFARNTTLGNDTDDRLYSNAVQNLVAESVKVTHTLKSDLPPSVSFTTEFFSPRPTFLIGCDHKRGNDEVSQVMFTPFAWDKINAGGGSIDATKVESSSPQPGLGGAPADRPGKIIRKTVPRGELNRNSMASFAFSLRTIREAESPLRPLIDSNIRAQWNNPRWDSPLGLKVIATHSMDFEGVAQEKNIQTDLSCAPRGYTYLGSGRTAADPNRVILFDVPRRDLVSLGQLQHAAAGRFSYEPSYIIGNSYANPRIPLTDWKAGITDTFSADNQAGFNIPGSFNLYDASYITNEVLWDSYTFTTLPQENDNFGGGDVPADYPALLAQTIPLPNPRHIPYIPAGSGFNAATLRAPGNATTGSFFHNAGHLLVDGSFNVNSTSIDAWEAFLSGTSGLPFGKINADGALAGFESTSKIRFPRVASSFGEGMSTSSYDENFWTGFRELEQEEVREIATEIVKEIKKRGPFLTMADFVNRRLEYGDTGKSGTLQAALDATVNKTPDPDFTLKAATGRKFSNLPDGATQGTGFPGQLLQGDVLQALAPYMTVRSDTFTIRAYGESRDGTNIRAKAWCEAVVQRYPDPLTPDTAAKPPLEELAQPSNPFGRQFHIISFRWMHPDEV